VLFLVGTRTKDIAMSWTPPVTFEDFVKRRLVPPRLTLARIVAREWRRGEPELRLTPFLVDPERAAVDAGANRGIWSEVMARHTRQVFAFEPNPKLFEFLQAAAGPRVTASQIALSDASGEAVLSVPMYKRGYSNQHATLDDRFDRTSTPVGKIRVKTRRLDDMDLPPIGFMKIDVEGFEGAVLRGASGLIARDKPVLVVEMEERHTARPIGVAIEEVQALGYRMMFVGPKGLTDGARFDPAAMHDAARKDYVNNFIFLPT
jgi:FkbM family methyltransferase